MMSLSYKIHFYPFFSISVQDYYILFPRIPVLSDLYYPNSIVLLNTPPHVYSQSQMVPSF